MTFRVQFQDGKLHLHFETPAEALALVEQALAQQGFLVEADRELRVFQKLPLVLGGVGWQMELGCEILQVFPGKIGQERVFQTALSLTGWTETRRKELETLARHPPGASPEPAPPPETPEAPPEKTEEVPAIYAIRELNVTEKMRLASKATRGERQVLLQDGSAQVLTALLGNPRLDPEEVVRLVQSPHASVGLIQQIAASSTWGGVYDVKKAIVKNPKTSLPLALKLLEQLHAPDVQMLARSQSVREDIRRAALRIVAKRQR